MSFFFILKNEGLSSVSKRIDYHIFEKRINSYTQEIKLSKCRNIPKNINDYKPLIFKKENNPVVSIIIPVFNKFDYTYNCLNSIINYSGDKTSYEIIIANDCSNDLTTRINEIISNINVITTPTNLGFLKNCNNASKYTKGKYILFLNNDTQVQENWLSPLVELIEKDKSIGAVGSKLVFKNGMLQEAGGIFWNDASALNYGRDSYPAMPEFNYVKEVDYISGASLMIKKSIWEKLGGFDYYFSPAYCEDSDICFSIRKIGYKVMYQPASIVVHFEGISNGTYITKGQKQYQVINQKKFYEKWEDILLKEHFPNGENIFHARDRSRYKKTILFIDRYVPHFDKDAGSRTVFQYLRLFVSLDFNIKFIGDDFYRDEPYTTIMEQMGIEVFYGDYYAQNWKKWLKTNGKFIHYVFLNRPHISIKYIDDVKEHTKAKVFYYGHDLHFLREMREYHLTNDKLKLQSSKEMEKIEFSIMNKVDFSYYPSQVEVDEIKKQSPLNCVKAIPAYLFEKKQNKERNFENTKDIMFIGGFQHKSNVDGILWYVREIYPILYEQRPDINTYILGSNPPNEVLKLNSEKLIVKGFVTDEQLLDYYRNSRLSIIPLRYGAGIKGKVVEAMYNQIPIVTTSIGAEGIKGAENCLFIKNEPAAFAEEIIRVYDDYKLLSEISVKEINVINEEFTITTAIKVIKDDFDL